MIWFLRRGGLNVTPMARNASSSTRWQAAPSKPASFTTSAYVTRTALSARLTSRRRVKSKRRTSCFVNWPLRPRRSTAPRLWVLHFTYRCTAPLSTCRICASTRFALMARHASVGLPPLRKVASTKVNSLTVSCWMRIAAFPCMREPIAAKRWQELDLANQ